MNVDDIHTCHDDCPRPACVAFREAKAAGRKSGRVIPFTGITRLDLPPDRILQAAVGKLEGVVVMGWDHEGKEYFASSYADGGTVLWLAERMKKMLLETHDD
jgi:hypothetical protein